MNAYNREPWPSSDNGWTARLPDPAGEARTVSRPQSESPIQDPGRFAVGVIAVAGCASALAWGLAWVIAWIGSLIDDVPLVAPVAWPSIVDAALLSLAAGGLLVGLVLYAPRPLLFFGLIVGFGALVITFGPLITSGQAPHIMGRVISNGLLCAAIPLLIIAVAQATVDLEAVDQGRKRY